MSVSVRGSRRAPYHVDVPVTHFIPSKYVIRRTETVPKGKGYFSKPGERKMVGKTEHAPTLIHCLLLTVEQPVFLWRSRQYLLSMLD